jgi:hypothetical protein
MLVSREDFVRGLWQTFKTFRETELDLGRVCYYPKNTSEAINDHHHGCPFPLHPYDDDTQSVVKWQERNRLWCYPADYQTGDLSVSIEGTERFPVACMGTMFWFVYYALKRCGLEQKISFKQLSAFQTKTLQDASEGVADAAIDLGLCVDKHNDPTKAKTGDLLGIRRNGSIHHWCIAFPKIIEHLQNGTYPSASENPSSEVYGNMALGTLGASPDAIGGEGQVGWDWYRHQKDSGNRSWIVGVIE